MTGTTLDRWFNATRAFESPFVVAVSASLVGLLMFAFVLTRALFRSGRIDTAMYKELMLRASTWVWLLPAMLLPLLLGAFWTVMGVLVLSLACYREYARTTGLFRERAVSATVVAGIVLVFAAVLDHWYGLFVALGSLTVVLIAAVAILSDRPQGYIQRVALGVLAFALFGLGLGHLGYMANDRDYRPILLLLLLAVEFNDMFAFLAGKLTGRRKLCPNTSPGKTVGGAVGALLLTTLLVAALGWFAFPRGPMHSLPALLGLGVVISVAGQMGDLMLSSIKRDVGIKDIGQALPGHGGLLDRFDSLLLVAPAAFHYIGYLQGFGLDQPVRLFTHG